MERSWTQRFAGLALAALLTACAATAPTGSSAPDVAGASEREQDRRAGWQAVTHQDLIDLRSGRTLMGNGFAVFYGDGGRKIAEVRGERLVRRWAVEDGRFCEDNLRTGDYGCLDSSRFLYRDGRMRQYGTDGSLDVEYDIVDGNALNLG